jgi:CRP/FNR family transcriptional regulator, cyclic AMP receptor protein
MAMSNVAPAPWGRPLGSTMDKDGLSEIEVRKRRILKRTPMASAATPASQQALVDAGAIQRVGKGRPLVCQGEQATAIAMIGMGRLRLTRALSDARTLSIGYRGTGDLVGEAALGGASSYRETAVATEDVEALLVPVATVRALVAADHAFGCGLLSVLVERHGDTEDRLASMLFRNVEARLAEFLVKAASRWGIPEPRGVLIAAPFTHQEMANMIGSTRETVTLTLGDLRKKGVIEIDRRRIVVLDREALKSRV